MNSQVTSSATTAGPGVERIRHEVRARETWIRQVERVTPAMLRLTLAGDDLADFRSPGFDDHVKIVVPDGSGGTTRRDYTPRRYDPNARSLVLDFAIHEAGPATDWATNARPGDRLEVLGPKGSAVIAKSVRDWLLVGDETALPAIGRRIEEAEPDTRIVSVVTVAGAVERQAFATSADLEEHWVHRPQTDSADPTALLAILDGIELQPERFVWIAAEAGVARAARDAILDRGHPRSWMKAGGYWIRGQADGHERLG